MNELSLMVEAAVSAAELPAHVRAVFVPDSPAEFFPGSKVRLICSKCGCEEDAVQELILDRETIRSGPHAVIALVGRFLRDKVPLHAHAPAPSSEFWREQLAASCDVLKAAATRDSPAALLGHLELIKARVLQGVVG